MITAVESLFFDWSGTLADDLAPVLRATNLVLAEHDKPGLTRAEFQRAFRLPFVHFWDQALAGVPLERIEESYHRHFVDRQDAVALLPGAHDILALAQRQRRRIFLLSSIKPAHFQRQAERLGVLGYFESSFTGVYDKRVDFPKILQQTRCRPERTVYVGDMVHDVEAARAAGVCAVAVLSGYDPVDKLRAACPDALLETVGDLIPFLRFGSSRQPITTVGALIEHPDGSGRILLCRSRKWAKKWGIPGGKVRAGEMLEMAMRREILEETGLRLSDVQIGPVLDSIDDPDYVPSQHFIIINYFAKAQSADVLLNDEADAFTWSPPQEALLMELNTPTQLLLKRCFPGDKP